MMVLHLLSEGDKEESQSTYHRQMTTWLKATYCGDIPMH
jgi:hypothetical protein